MGVLVGPAACAGCSGPREVLPKLKEQLAFFQRSFVHCVLNILLTFPSEKAYLAVTGLEKEGCLIDDLKPLPSGGLVVLSFCKKKKKTLERVRR